MKRKYSKQLEDDDSQTECVNAGLMASVILLSPLIFSAIEYSDMEKNKPRYSAPPEYAVSARVISAYTAYTNDDTILPHNTYNIRVMRSIQSKTLIDSLETRTDDLNLGGKK